MLLLCIRMHLLRQLCVMHNLKFSFGIYGCFRFGSPITKANFLYKRREAKWGAKRQHFLECCVEDEQIHRWYKYIRWILIVYVLMFAFQTKVCISPVFPIDTHTRLHYHTFFVWRWTVRQTLGKSTIFELLRWENKLNAHDKCPKFKQVAHRTIIVASRHTKGWMKKWKQGEEMQSDKDYKCIQMHFRFDRHHANGLITAFGEKITHTPYTVCVCVFSTHTCTCFIRT